MRHLRWMLLLVVLAGLGLGLRPAAAQQPPAIERLGVALWPEYDQPAMLVILRVQLAPGTALPAEVTLPIPASAGEPLAVAYTTADGALLNAPYTRQVQGDWALITLTSETPNAQVEYYQPLQISGTQRDFLYEWPGGQDLGMLSYEVQHPVGAQAMTIDPPAQSSAPRPDGLLYSFADLGPVPGMETRQIQLSYQRAVVGAVNRLGRAAGASGRRAGRTCRWRAGRDCLAPARPGGCRRGAGRCWSGAVLALTAAGFRRTGARAAPPAALVSAGSRASDRCLGRLLPHLWKPGHRHRQVLPPVRHQAARLAAVPSNIDSQAHDRLRPLGETEARSPSAAGTVIPVIQAARPVSDAAG